VLVTFGSTGNITVSLEQHQLELFVLLLESRIR
jgi:hypothetical protein